MSLVKDVLLWTYWNPFRILIQKMSAPRAHGVARLLGRVLRRIAGGKRARLTEEFAFISGPNAGRLDTEQVVEEAFFVFMCNEIEALLFPVMNEKNIDSFVTCSSLEHLDKALTRGKGAMLLFAHFGANQMVMPAVGYKGYKMCQLSAPPTAWAKQITDRRFSRMEMRALNRRWEHDKSLPVKHVNVFGSLKEALLCLKRNEVLGLAIDGGGGKEKTNVNFLGHEALFATGAAEIAIRTDCTILPTFMLRKADGMNEMIVERPIEKASGVEEDAIRETTQRFVDRLAEYVLKYPGHYVNFLEVRTLMAGKGDEPLFPDRGQRLP
jgi:lauroyl/myristoyl acyltransferase